MREISVIAALFCVLSMFCVAAHAQRQIETLDRGVVAVRQPDGNVFISWRLLATDPSEISFNLYRQTPGQPPVKLNAQPLVQSTCYVDTNADFSSEPSYFVRPVVDRDELPPSNGSTASAQPWFTIPLQTPTGYTPNDASVGDLDGDGVYEIILHQTGRSHDNSHSGPTDPPILQAYTLDGTLLWQIDLGRNIREGAHYTQFLVYDFDGDGRAELVCKTADGSRDAAGRVIGDSDADHRNERGFILTGPEYLTVFDGLTGRAIATTDYIPPRVPATTSPAPAQIEEIWGDDYGNRADRFLAAVAYLDGRRSSIVMCRGYYTRSVLAAFNFRDGKLTHLWTFDSDDPDRPQNRAYRGQGNHNLAVADVDDDGRDEIIYGACVIDDDGTGLYSTGLGHGDALHVADLDPRNPGLEVFDIHERPPHPHGIEMHDARTGRILWSHPSPDVARGLAADVDPDHPGDECWAVGEGLDPLYDARGNVIAPVKPSSCNFAVWWDGDPLRELLDEIRVDKWDWRTNSETRLLTAEGCASNNGTKATPVLCADILGDWREEIIWRTADSQSLRIYTTTIPTAHRFPTLMHDPVYRLSVAWQNVAYNQPTRLSFSLTHAAPARSHDAGSQ